MRSLLAALVVSGSLACGSSSTLWLDGPAAVPQPGPPTRQRLEQDAASFRVQPVSSLGSLTTQRLIGPASAVPIHLADGSFEVQALDSQAGPLLAVTHFDASLDDVSFTPEQLPPAGLTLTSVRFSTGDPQLLQVQWLGDGNVGLAKGSLTVEVHSALRLSTGGESPLAVAQFEVPVALTVGQTANGLIGLWLDITPAGSMWNWAGLVELRDLALAVQAYTPGTPSQLPPGVELN